MSIEDEIFADALTALKINLNKKMYARAQYPHICSLCTGDSDELGYKLKVKERFIDQHYSEIISPTECNPYLFICKECYEELPDGE